MSTGKKLGRPFTSEKPLEKDLKVRVDSDTYDKLNAISKKEKITIAEVVRKSIKEFLDRRT